MTSPSKDLVLYCDYFERPSHEETPRIRFQDVIFGKVRPQGNLSSYHGDLRFHLTIVILPLVRFESEKLQLPG
jgi:hypothetical protein